ncbi:unnamed protein product [Didymodactylos carnosus]|nr:unnamed protein product [Didymodactylos carnosus]CAF3667715.1 unnamed protein product [Didymodactylos carnosus]
MLFWWFIVILIENWKAIRRYCRRRKELPAFTEHWDDSNLDEDVKLERRAVLNNTLNNDGIDNDMSNTNQNSTTFHPSQAVIYVQDLLITFEKRKEKSFRSQLYTAVDHLNFHVDKRSCFGLLGSNGAGKTTTFRMLTGELKPTSGHIIINGKDIHKAKTDVEIGFCPQFDWLVHGLNVNETLTLFARLKGLSEKHLPDILSNTIELFGLNTYEKRQVQKLSGGNRRKVSAALAFMANPSLVFLDEPTTGLDAAAKRKLWDVVRAARDAGLTIILTSHSMEECEALCTRIGIMKLGQFRCLGGLQHLKNKFGKGYGVIIKANTNDIEAFKANLRENLPGIQFDDEHNGMLFCNVPFDTKRSANINTTANSSFNLARVFQLLNQKKDLKEIESYSVTQTTLEQIFVRLAGQDNAREAEIERRKSLISTTNPYKVKAR